MIYCHIYASISVAIRRPQWEVMAVRPPLVDGAGDGRVREKPGAIGGKLGTLRSDFLDPVGVEQGRGGGAIRQRELFACRPRLANFAFEPVVGDVQPLAG